MRQGPFLLFSPPFANKPNVERRRARDAEAWEKKIERNSSVDSLQGSSSLLVQIKYFLHLFGKGKKKKKKNDS
jgi:hypothetical protein